MATLQLKGFEEAQKLMAKLPNEIATVIARKAMKAAGEVLRTAAIQAAPRSKMTGTWNTQSKKTQNDSPKPLAETILLTSKTFSSGVTVVMVGPAWPAGAHGYNVEHGHKAYWWGRSSGWTRIAEMKFNPNAAALNAEKDANRAGGRRFKIYTKHKTQQGSGAYVPGKKWFAPVVDSTRSQQEAAMISVMQAEAAKIK